MITQIFLTIVGLMYAVLALWCLLKPVDIMKKLGFDVIHSGGQSEFLTIYVGMEVAFALIFMLPLLQKSFTFPILVVCTILHGGLALARAASFVLYPQIPTFTYRLGTGEWVIFILSTILALTYARA